MGPTKLGSPLGRCSNGPEKVGLVPKTDETVRHCTTHRRAGRILNILRGKTSVPEGSDKHGLAEVKKGWKPVLLGADGIF